jgi:hypothetical protein
MTDLELSPERVAKCVHVLPRTTSESPRATYGRFDALRNNTARSRDASEECTKASVQRTGSPRAADAPAEKQTSIFATFTETLVFLIPLVTTISLLLTT